MRQFLDRASMSFAAGAFGALVNSLAIWAAGAYHLTARLGIGIAPGLTPNWLYPRIVWGGFGAFCSCCPWCEVTGGCAASFSASRRRRSNCCTCFRMRPVEGFFGLGLGALTPAFVLAANAIWGLSAAWLLRTTGRA